jgi:hypothetical protein
MFEGGSLTFREFAMRETLPLAMIHDAVLQFLSGRTDAVLFGAHAVNAYVDDARMSQDVDILSPRAEEFAEELRTNLSQRFQIEVRVRTIELFSGIDSDPPAPMRAARYLTKKRAKRMGEAHRPWPGPISTGPAAAFAAL